VKPLFRACYALQSGADRKRLVPRHPSSGRFINQN
jgi:hypothetical protein